MSSLSTSAQRLDGVFGATRWSLVVALREPTGDGQAPLTELMLSYCYPVYAYLRHRGQTIEQARRSLLGFFAFLAEVLEATNPVASGRFRTFLLERLQQYLGQGGGKTPIALAVAAAIPFDELEQRLSAERWPGIAAESAFERNFALQVLARAREQLRSEAERSNRLPMYQRLAAYLSVTPSAEQIATIAAELGIGNLAVQVAIKQLRQRFRALAEVELQQTVAGPADLEVERAALHAILAERP